LTAAFLWALQRYLLAEPALKRHAVDELEAQITPYAVRIGHADLGKTDLRIAQLWLAL
jgi:Na+/phosphate symporter